MYCFLEKRINIIYKVMQLVVFRFFIVLIEVLFVLAIINIKKTKEDP